MLNDQPVTYRPTRLRTAALTGFLIAVPTLLAGCSGSTAAPVSSSAPSSASTAVMTSTSDEVITRTDVVTDTSEVTRTSEDTRTKPSKPAGGGTTSSGGGGTATSSGTDSCPDPATLGAVTPNYNPQYPINAINCSGEWAVGTYEADGKNQTTGIWRNTGGAWAYQNRADICATADNLPDELYTQACEGN